MLGLVVLVLMFLNSFNLYYIPSVNKNIPDFCCCIEKSQTYLVYLWNCLQSSFGIIFPRAYYITFWLQLLYIPMHKM